jgi:hypothetical protein
VPGCACADCFTARKEEHDAGVLPLPSRVAAAAQPEQTPEQTAPATAVTILREVEPEDSRAPETEAHALIVSIGTKPKRPPLVGGTYEHGPLCECEWCDAPLQPRYARAWSEA